MFDLSTSLLFLLIICLLTACAFEFVNGFHDTANAVATVIYTNSLKPLQAVIWSGFCNFSGVISSMFIGGLAVAMSIVNLLPVESLIDQNVYHSIAMVLALLLSAIIWNLGTWYLGIPASSSHTLIGSILGVGLAFTFMPESTGSAVNWSKASEIGLSLLISPLFGFGMTIFLMYLIRRLSKNKTLFEEPKPNQKPPFLTRSLLILTCSGVSFFHGSNDGQKGVGLIMLILIGIVPVFYALDGTKNPSHYKEHVLAIERVIEKMDTLQLSGKERKSLALAKEDLDNVNRTIYSAQTINDIPKEQRFSIRKDILVSTRVLDKIIKGGNLQLADQDIKILKAEIKKVKELTDYSPFWVVLVVSISLGLGTMVGWKRIVVTVGEKIGKQHLTYAQGASAELVAASTIGLSSFFGLPVSTTHVLSSGIAGSMVASKGMSNLQPKTIKNILLAWVLTLPVTMILSALLYILFRAIL